MGIALKPLSDVLDELRGEGCGPENLKERNVRSMLDRFYSEDRTSEMDTYLERGEEPAAKKLTCAAARARTPPSTSSLSLARLPSSSSPTTTSRPACPAPERCAWRTVEQNRPLPRRAGV